MEWHVRLSYSLHTHAFASTYVRVYTHTPEHTRTCTHPYTHTETYNIVLNAPNNMKTIHLEQCLKGLGGVEFNCVVQYVPETGMFYPDQEQF